MRKMRKIILVSFILLLLPSASWAAQVTDRFEKVTSRMVKAINDANWPGVQADFGQVMLDAFGPDKSVPFFQGLVAQNGKIVKLDAGRYTPPDIVVFPAHFERGILDIKIVLDNQDKIIGLWFLPHAADIPVVEKHQTPLTLPFKGKWLVFWGGDTKELNYHHDTPNQRFAFDFVGVGEDGKTHKGEGKTNEDYFAFGREILAPADGVVTDVINGVRDNVPGSMNPYSAIGNAVLIQHRDNEISVMAHFKLDSIKVKVGDKITKGQPIGLCGNSGNSSEPHLHYHLQNTPVIQDGSGIKCLFQKVTIIKNGQEQAQTDYSPVKGDVILAN
jgi:murein DD-endopeptidase MepM/ murein hydrolase activator NlpD